MLIFSGLNNDVVAKVEGRVEKRRGISFSIL